MFVEIRSNCLSLISETVRALRLGDKFDRSMTLGTSLDNNIPFFIFIS